MRLSAHGERKRRLFIHGLNLKLRWHRKERTICCWLPPFEKDVGCSRTHMKSLFYQSELIRRISSDTKQKRHENASTTNITLDHFGVHISSTTLLCSTVFEHDSAFFVGVIWALKNEAQLRRKGKLWKYPIVPTKFCHLFCQNWNKRYLYLPWFHHHKQLYFEVNLPTLLLSNQERFRLNTCCSVAGQQQLCKIFWYNSFIVAHTIQGQQKLAKKSTQFIIMVSSLILLSLAWHLIKDFIFEAKKPHLQV